jgi:hypothetical protein
MILMNIFNSVYIWSSKIYGTILFIGIFLDFEPFLLKFSNFKTSQKH